MSIPDDKSAPAIEANAKGLCYINTKQLDGETNLKMFQAKPETAKYFKCTGDFGKLNMKLNIEGPGHENSGNLYKFSGKMEWEQESKPISGKMECEQESKPMIVTHDQLLLRGHVMEQTHTAWGLVVNTGMQTKIQMNLAGEKPYKISSMEEMLNKQVMLVFVMLGTCVLICGIGLGVWLGDHGDDAWYIFVAPINGVDETWDSNSELFGVGIFDPDDVSTSLPFPIFEWSLYAISGCFAAVCFVLLLIQVLIMLLAACCQISFSLLLPTDSSRLFCLCISLLM